MTDIAAPGTALSTAPENPTRFAGIGRNGCIRGTGPVGPAPATAATRSSPATHGRDRAKFGTTPKAISNLNGISDPSSLKIGQVLKIP
jgi:LysM repeat protein